MLKRSTTMLFIATLLIIIGAISAPPLPDRFGDDSRLNFYEAIVFPNDSTTATPAVMAKTGPSPSPITSTSSGETMLSKAYMALEIIASLGGLFVICFGVWKTVQRRQGDDDAEDDAAGAGAGANADAEVAAAGPDPEVLAARLELVFRFLRRMRELRRQAN